MQLSATTVSTVCSKISIAAMLVLILAPLSGCRICNSTEDLAYPSYGGAWERTIRDSGRVGSLFDPAGVRSSALTAKDDAVTQDELERGRRNAQDTDDEDPSGGDDTQSDDSMQDDADANDGPNQDGEETDDDLKRRMEKLRDQDLDDVKIIPGDALPPLLR